MASGVRLAAPLALAFLAVASSAAADAPETDCPAAPPVAAPALPEIRVGSCFSSSIGPDDPKNQNNTSYEDWRLDLQEGETVQIDMDSIPTRHQSASGELSPAYPFDTYLELRAEGSDEPLETNDDREGSLNSRILFTALATDHYVVRARPLFSGDGDYRLSVSRPPPLAVATPIAAGQTRIDAGALAGDAAGAVRTRLFSFEGTPGEIVRFSLPADAMLNIRMRLTAPGGQILGEVGELGGNRALAAILPVAGSYELRLEMPPAATTLTFQRRVAGAAPVPQPVRTGQTVVGEIGFDSSVGRDPYGSGGLSFYQLYQLPLRAGQQVTVTLESTAFDPALDAGQMTLLGFAAALTNDDDVRGGTLNSRLVLRPPRSGIIYLRARALGDGSGPFRLRIRPGDVPSAPAAR